MRSTRFRLVAPLLLAAFAGPAAAASAPDHWVVQPQWVAAHEAFLASDALQGRGSATRDEAIAAAYVASQFQGYGLNTAPGMAGYLQTATIVKIAPAGAPALTVDGKPIAGAALLVGSGEPINGAATVFAGADATKLPSGGIVLASGAGDDVLSFLRATRTSHTQLLILRRSTATDKLLAMIGGAPRMPSYLEDAPPKPAPTIVTLPAAAFDALARKPGATLTFQTPVTKSRAVTTNAIGYLAGTDPSAGTLLFTAHLDHLGVRPDGVVMHGANDDASGTTAVLELAHALAAGERPKRSILFVCYGSEEIGEYGSTYFGEHPPIPLDQIIANVEFEMIGAQDPKLPAGTMMMTGFDRSNLGAALKAHGALVTGDPYPDQHFFERSDNYALALKGIVAHTVSGWAVTPTYHQPTDTLANLDLPFMTRAIQSMIAPVQWLANSDFKPAWAPTGKPAE
ncbi:M28 family peptidase [Sphingomonas koreensis]|nr:M28 family peptidase [Sphingomonas koreensis]